ncbi:MAG: hypothetical protein U9Q71_02450, partial [Pseudomonadota bacterium]|nr:hypothetical protein [Pseudomonadota bacterium]
VYINSRLSGRPCQWLLDRQYLGGVAMTDRLPAGPYRVLQLEDGTEFPYYIIPFDKRGLCQAPETRDQLVSHLSTEDYTDVYLFSHGWNNDWTVATDRYEHFIEGFMKMRRDRSLPVPDGYKPLLIGVFWPSTALAFTEAEKGPQFSAGTPEVVDEAIREERLELEALAEDLEPAQAETLYRLAQKKELSEDEARQLAEIGAAIYELGDDELGLDTTASTDEILEVWASLGKEEDDLGEFIAGGADLGVAGIGDFFKKIDPRKVVRALTVFKMKDRAGKVGASGVHRLLHDILAASEARVHLVGHSYGGKIVLSATCGGDLPSGKKVTSMLLLQPAVSHLCFAEKVPGTDRSGGYRPALKRVDRPILSTFSSGDFPLTKTFHLALRRKSDLGEARIAAAGDPPSKYAALGGFGPRGAGEQLIDIQDPGQDYQLDNSVPIYGLRGDRTISGHGDISNLSTWWALYSLTKR